MRVLEVDRHDFRVVGSCQGADLKSAVDGAAEQETNAIESQLPLHQRPRSYAKRRIGHPLFKNGTLEQVQSTHDQARARARALLIGWSGSQVTRVLALAPVGEVIFRPSSKGLTHLTATLKLTLNGPLLHVDIAEEAKASAGEVCHTNCPHPHCALQPIMEVCFAWRSRRTAGRSALHRAHRVRSRRTF